ncbi:hypothetical protein NP233_g9300 [Leucocoprinus birnbaumii]|uniref:rRNA-processing protein FYV7 n=1 Tax=Leucocoprinus birnbaumii TaxID=56174 RepID=A0AAD5VKR3_9AGAR|nr:hypothetical protein NP233_g9300 [Leucocoprinus birnbaumii]
MPDAGQKRKRPPTFQHFPRKKLKKAWVEKAKIKSKWKAQKRREGIAVSRSVAPPPDDEDRRDSDVGSADENDKGSHSDDSEPIALSDSEADSTSESAEEDETEVSSNKLDAAHPPPPPPPRLPRAPKKYNHDNNTKRPLPHDKNNKAVTKNGVKADEGQDKPSLREMFQKAYSKESLHSYKSDPLKRGRNEQHGRGRGRGGRGGTRGGNASARGRGQPDMKLRMSAMLEKIKRDYS